MVEVSEAAVHGVDGLVIGNVIAEVHVGRREAGSDPDGVHTKFLQGVELGGDAVEVTNAVVVRIRETARVAFVENGVPPPGMAFGVEFGLLRARRGNQNSNESENGEKFSACGHGWS